MKRLLVCSLLLIIFLSLAVRPCQGWSWACQFEVWSSPYHAHKIYAGALNCSRSFSAKLTGGIILPLQIMTGLEGQDLQLFFPSLKLCWRHPFQRGVTGKLEIKCDPRQRQIQVDGGVEVLSDPLLIQYSITRQGGANHLNVGALFAVNERWALGAHLKYGKNPLLTYQMHHIASWGGTAKFNYSSSPDGALQCLGLEIAF